MKSTIETAGTLARPTHSKNAAAVTQMEIDHFCIRWESDDVSSVECKYSWDEIRDVYSADYGDAGVRTLYVFLYNEVAPILIREPSEELKVFIARLHEIGKSPEPLSEIIFWSLPGKLLRRGQPPSVDKATQTATRAISSVVYAGNARWFFSLTVNAPPHIEWANLKRADSVLIYLKIKHIDFLFVDSLVDQSLLEKIAELRMVNAVRLTIIAVDSTKSSPRAAHLLRTRMIDRLVQLPFRRSVLQALLPADDSSGHGAAVLFATADILLVERLRDEIEQWQPVFAINDETSLRATLRQRAVSTLLVDIRMSDAFFLAAHQSLISSAAPPPVVGVRCEVDQFRTTAVLARGWVQRIIDSDFSPDSLTRAGLVPKR